MTVDTPIASVSLCDTWRPLEATAGATFTGVATNLPFPPPFLSISLPVHRSRNKKERKTKNWASFSRCGFKRESWNDFYFFFGIFSSGFSWRWRPAPLLPSSILCAAFASSRLEQIAAFFPFFFPFFKNVFSNYYFQPLFFLLLSLIAFSELKEKWASNINFFDWFSATIERMKEILV